MQKIRFTLITALIISFTQYSISQCKCSTPNIASLNGSNNAESDINAANLSVGNATISLQRTFGGTAVADEYEINNS